MKIPPFFAMAALIVATPWAAEAAGRKIDNVTPKISLVGTPEIVAQVRGMQPKRAHVPSPGEPTPVWVEFETDFDSAEEFPELTLKYSMIVAVPGKRPRLLEGECTLVDVPRGRERHSVMYVGPKTLNRLAEGKPFSANNVKAFWVEFQAQGETVGLGFKAPQGGTFEQAQALKAELEKVQDGLLNKSQTPFAPLFWDYYEATKPSGR